MVQIPGTQLHVFAGKSTVGHWCPTCFLPSGIQLELFGVSMAGVGRMGTHTRCRQCHAAIVVT